MNKKHCKQSFHNPKMGTCFVGKDIADGLKYNEPHKALSRHVDEDDRTKHPIMIHRLLDKIQLDISIILESCK